MVIRMKAFVTSELSKEAIEEWKKILQDEVIYESWREKRNLYFSAEDLVAKIKETGANGYFLKPFKFSEFDLLYEDLWIIKIKL